MSSPDPFAAAPWSSPALATEATNPETTPARFGELAALRFPSVPLPAWILAGVRMRANPPTLRAALQSGDLPPKVREIASRIPGAAEKPNPVAAAVREALKALGIAPKTPPAVPAPARASGAAYRPPLRLAKLAPAIDRAAANGTRTSVRLVGPSGSGKTSAAAWLAETLSRPLHIADCSTMIEPDEWYGSVGLSSGSTGWDPAPFAEAVATERSVIVLDEVNRMSPAVQNGLLPLLDHRGECRPPRAPAPVRVAPGVIFLATMNTGARHSGTEALDAALRNRFPLTVRTGWLDPLEEVEVVAQKAGIPEVEAARIVAVAVAVREAEATPGEIELDGELASTRATLAAAMLVAAGAELRDAVDAAIVEGFPAERLGSSSPKDRVAAIVEGILG